MAWPPVQNDQRDQQMSTLQGTLVRAGRSTARWPALIFVAYAVILVWLLVRHEVWRDEVRAYSIARTATDPVDLIRHRLADEGHPGLWHLILWLGSSVVQTPAVVKVASYLVAVAFSALVFFRSPFPLLHRTLFLAGMFPLHTFSVVARNYGLSALFLFLLANEYSARDRPRAWLAGVYNALLANTNVIGTICSVAFLLVPWYHKPGLRGAGLRAKGAIAALTGLGIFLAVYTMWPSAKNQALDVPDRRPPTAVTDRSVPAVLRGVVVVAMDREGWSTLILAGERWKSALVRVLPEPMVAAICAAGVVLLCAPLVRMPSLLAAFAAAFVATGLFSRHLHLVANRHIGVLAAFYFAMLWVAWRWAPRPETPGSWVGLWVMAACLLMHAWVGLSKTVESVRSPYSQSRNAGAFLLASYHDWPVICEPDFFAESLVYYAPNPIYFPREERFGTFVRFMQPFNRDLSLTEVVRAARRLNQETGHPVLISLAAPIAEIRAWSQKHPSQRMLLVSDDEAQDFEASYREVGRFVGPGAETYVFYAPRR